MNILKKIDKIQIHNYLLFLFRDVAVAGVLVCIILVFIICHSFKFVPNIYEIYKEIYGKS